MASKLLGHNKSKEGEEEDKLSEANKDDKSKDDNDNDVDARERKLIVDWEFLGACARNDLDKVKYWLKQGADVNCWTDDDDETGKSGEDVFVSGLKYAATRNYPELCDLLLEHPNIDVNMKEVRTYNGTYYGRSGSWYLVHTSLILAVMNIVRL